jgi:hypothetical protein
VLARLLLCEADVRFVDERGGLERVSLALATELPRGDAAEFGVHRLHEQRQGRRVAVGPVVQQTRDVVA